MELDGVQGTAAFKGVTVDEGDTVGDVHFFNICGFKCTDSYFCDGVR